MFDDVSDSWSIESRNKKLNLVKINLASLFSRIEYKYRYDDEKAGLQITLRIPENPE